MTASPFRPGSQSAQRAPKIPQITAATRDQRRFRSVEPLTRHATDRDGSCVAKLASCRRSIPRTAWRGARHLRGRAQQGSWFVDVVLVGLRSTYSTTSPSGWRKRTPGPARGARFAWTTIAPSFTRAATASSRWGSTTVTWGCCSVGVLRPVELEDEKGAHRHNVQSLHRNVHVHVDSGVLSMNVKRSLVIMPAGPPRLTDRDAGVARSQHYVASVS